MFTNTDTNSPFFNSDWSARYHHNLYTAKDSKFYVSVVSVAQLLAGSMVSFDQVLMNAGCFCVIFIYHNAIYTLFTF